MALQHNVSLQGRLQFPAEKEQAGGPSPPKGPSWEIPVHFGLVGEEEATSPLGLQAWCWVDMWSSAELGAAPCRWPVPLRKFGSGEKGQERATEGHTAWCCALQQGYLWPLPAEESWGTQVCHHPKLGTALAWTHMGSLGGSRG